MYKEVVLLLPILISSTLAVCPLGSRYNSDYNKCYQYFPNASTFLSAEESCRAIGGNLVYIQNAFENTFLAGLVYPYAYDFWIGASLLMSSQWTWTNGYYLNYWNFASGQPSDPSMYQCASYRSVDSTWTKQFCSSQRGYMCSFDPNAAPVGNCPTPIYPTSAPTPPSSCPTGHCDVGYTLNPNACKCFKINFDKYTYPESMAYCQAENATMPIILNKAENSWLKSFVKSNSGRGDGSPWIDLLCGSSSASNCHWSDGSGLLYANFASGSPSNSNGGSPLVYIDQDDGKWYSFSSTGFVNSVVCEKHAAWN